ncbi:extracellular solute-binding protein [Sinomonas sp. ASV486]|uniref:ABC transporter substrate-binding protein n=1 Tax=Sinomonas sp. ASV486 TaxID=3051170 RepID=UPI0027DBD00C|nr:extracellular solute-binding protein [Sinomonas sp. ASV486]MDQ4492033.1 extracellular solute-binding protein [Sinomonas sp. ASV486]
MTTLTRRTALKLFAGTAAVGLLAGCGTGGGKNADGSVTLRFTWWGNDVRNKQTQQVIDAFQAAHPNIKIQAEPGVWSGYWDKLATQTAANDAPDVIQMDLAYIAEYGGRGALLDLTKQKELDTSSFDANTLAAGQYGGKLYGVSTGQNALAIFANVKVFQAAGVPLPNDATWTWDGYLATAKALGAGASQGGATNYGASYGITDQNLSMWLRQRGESLYTNDGQTGFTVDGVASFMAFQKKLLDAKAAPPASVAQEDIGAAVEQTLAATNKTGMSFWWTNQLGALTKATGSDIKLLRVPSQDGSSKDNGLFYKPSMYWSASSRSKHPAEAATFIDYLVNSTDVAKVITTERGFSTSQKVQDAIKPLLTPTDKTALGFLTAIKPEVGSAPAVPPVGTSKVADALGRRVTDVLFGRADAQASAAAFKNDADMLIKNAKK